MYHTPGRRRATSGTPRAHQVPEGPITDLTTLIAETLPEDWQQRVCALEDLVRMIPDGSKYLDGAAWYNTPKTLWHLAQPAGELLKDPRSSVVRRVCAALTELFNKCQSDARLFFKDLMPTVLVVQAQTVAIIRQAVTTMVTEAIPEVPCKSVMPFWMDRLKDKSPAVRDACALYLDLALQSWTEEGYLTDEIWTQVGSAYLKTMRDPSPSVRVHAKAALERMRRQHPHRWDAMVSDPNGPAARDPRLRQWLQSLHVAGSSLLLGLDEVEDLSVASKYTYNSDSRHAAAAAVHNQNNNTTMQQHRTTNNLRISSPRLLKLNLSSSNDESDSNPHGGLRTSYHPRTNNGTAQVPFSIAVTHSGSSNNNTNNIHQRSSSSSSGNLGPPLRPRVAAAAPFSHVVHSPPPTNTVSRTGTPPRPPQPMMGGNYNSGGKSSLLSKKSSPQAQTYSALAQRSSEEVNDNDDDDDLEYTKSHNRSSERLDDGGVIVEQQQEQRHVLLRTVEEGPFIASMHELKKHASRRRSRNSVLMQERFRRISISRENTNHTLTAAAEAVPLSIEEGGGENENKIPNGDSPPAARAVVTIVPASKQPSPPVVPMAQPSSVAVSSPNAPEHIVIAIRLLRAHKAHVDQIMETLKLEMDTLRDFDRLLEEPGRPSEDELINYYEAVDLCLAQRLAAGLELRQEMNRISVGDDDTLDNNNHKILDDDHHNNDRANVAATAV